MKVTDKHKYRAKVSVIVLLMMSLFTISISAWFDTSQHKTNTFSFKEGNGVLVVTKYGEHEDGTLLNLGLKDVGFQLYKLDGDEEIPLGPEVYTDNSGILRIDGLSEGDYFLEEISPPPGYDYALDENDKPIKRHYFTVDMDVDHGVIQIAIKNVRISGSFSIEKILDTSNAIDVNEHIHKEFEFVVFFGNKVDNPNYPDEVLYDYVLNDGSKHQVSNGGSILLKGGQKASFNNLPYGLRYKVIEKNPDGYIVTSENSMGTHLNDTNVVFTNAVPEDGTGMIVLSKEVSAQDGVDLPENAYDKEFEFTITFDDGRTYPAKYEDGVPVTIASGDRIKLKHGDKLTIYDLPFDLGYTISELSYVEEGWFAEIETVTGNVGSNTKPIHHPFHNIYRGDNPEPEITTSLLLRKEVLNPYHQDHIFDFKISFDQDFEGYVAYSDGTLIPFKNGMIVSIRNLEEVKITGIPVGSSYTIEEAAKDDYEMLSEKYEGTLTSLAAEVVAYNNYVGPETNEGYLEIEKEVIGIQTDKKFEFELHVNGEIIRFELGHGDIASYTYPDGTDFAVYERDYSDDGYILNLIGGQGTIKKGENLVVKAVNTYDKSLEKVEIKGEKTWNLKNNPEIKLPESIILDFYDGTGKVVETLSVTPDKDGNWNYKVNLPKYDKNDKEHFYTVRERSIEGFSATYDGFDVTNTYLGITSFDINVSKIINGIENVKKDETFTFTIQSLDGAPSAKRLSVKITGEGSASFGAIGFKKPGIYKYVVSEVEVRDSNYQYDTFPVVVSIEVIETESGLKVANVTYTKNGETVENVTFTNTYKKDIKPNPEDPKDPEKPVKPPVEEKPNKPGKPEKPSGGGGHFDDLPLPHTGVADQRIPAKATLFVAIGLAFILINLKRKNEELIHYEKHR